MDVNGDYATADDYARTVHVLEQPGTRIEESNMAKPRPTFMKRQREMAKREKRERKAARRAARQAAAAEKDDTGVVVLGPAVNAPTDKPVVITSTD